MALGIFTGGLTSIVAVILAYVKRGDATGTIYQGHMTWVISPFWVGLAVSILGMMTMIIGDGLLIINGIGCWYLYSVIRGRRAAIVRSPDKPFVTAYRQYRTEGRTDNRLR